MNSRGLIAALSLAAITACARDDAGARSADAALEASALSLARLFSEGVPAFGVFVPNERDPGERGPGGERLPPLYTPEGARRLAENRTLDFLFLNLETSYDPGAVETFADALAAVSGAAPALLVRIPPIEADGVDLARARVDEVLALGADGIIMPHVRSPAEALLVATILAEAGANVWTPSRPAGDVILVLMIEDGGALAAVAEIAETPGISTLAVGIGSMTRALGGDAGAAEAAKLEVLREATRVGLPDMTIATSADVVERVSEGFRMLLLNGPDAEQGVLLGRNAR